MSDNTLWKQVEEANQFLKDAGDNAVTHEKVNNWWGFQAQYVIDAANAALGPENWRYAVKVEALEKTGKLEEFEAEVEIFIRDPQNPNIWISKGIQYGAGRSGKGRTNGKKAAISDALKKALALLSIGCNAYRGDLEDEDWEPATAVRGRGGNQGGSDGNLTLRKPDPEPAPPPAREEKPARRESKPAKEEKPASFNARQAPDQPAIITDQERTLILTKMQELVLSDGKPFFQSKDQVVSFLRERGYAVDRVSELPAMHPENGQPTIDVMIEALNGIAENIGKVSSDIPQSPLANGGMPWQNQAKA